MNPLQERYADLVEVIANDPALLGLWQEFQNSLTDENRKHFEDYRSSPDKRALPVEELTPHQMEAYFIVYHFLSQDQQEMAKAVIGKPLSFSAIYGRVAELDDLLQPAGNQTDQNTPTDPAIRSLQGVIDHARQETIYLIFDLEATKRENRYFRQLLETRRHRKRDDDA